MKKKININNFIQGKKLGSGGYADVFIVTDKKTSKNYAAKKMHSYLNINPSKEEIENLRQEELDLIKNINREIEILSMISHPAIIAFYGYSPVFFDNNPYPTLIMELASNQSLSNLLDSVRKGLAPSEWNTKKYINIYGIAKAMSFIHEKNVIHRDLKPDNILLNKLLYPKVSDFGFSKISDSMENMNSKACGTPVYMAPEMLGLDQLSYTNKIDVYAFSMIMYEILTLEKPFANVRMFAIYKLVTDNNRPKLPEDGSISEEFIKLIEQCWSQDPEERPTFAQICEKLESNEFEMIKNMEIDEPTFEDYINYLKQEVIDHSIPYEIQQDNNENSKNELKAVQFDLTNNEDNKITSQSRRATLPPQSPVLQQLNNNNNKKHDKPLNDTNYSSDEDNTKDDDSTETNINLIKSKSENDYPEAGNYWISSSDFKNLDQSCKKYYEAAEKNDSDAMTYVGQSFVKGINGFPHNVEIGIKFLQKAIELNNQESMIIYGDMLLNGIEIPQNKQEGISLLNRVSKDFENSQANLKLAVFFIQPEKNEKGQIISLPNYPKAKRCSKEAADNGNVEAMVLYAQLCMREHNNEHGKVRRNLKEATKYLKIAIRNGSAEAMSLYGELKEQYLGIEDYDKEEAIKFYNESKIKGNLDGKSHYGLAQIKTGNKEKEKEGLKLIIDSKEEKNVNAINSYGLVIDNGLCGLPANKNEAAACFKEAAGAGNANAMYNYAKCLEKGNGVEKNFKEAYKYYKFAFERGEIRAAKNIANMLFNGDDKSGFPPHLESGNRYLKMLADYGNAAGINLYASNLLDGFGIDKNEKEAVYYLKNGIEKNDSNSLLLYGLFLLATKDASIKKSTDPAAYIKKAVKLGNVKAKEKCDFYIKGGFNAERNLKEAIKYVRDVYNKD